MNSFIYFSVIGWFKYGNKRYVNFLKRVLIVFSVVVWCIYAIIGGFDSQRTYWPGRRLQKGLVRIIMHKTFAFRL